VKIDPTVADLNLRDDLLHLKRLGFIDSCGHGQWAAELHGSWSQPKPQERAQ
jgi:hypothetical protein